MLIKIILLLALSIASFWISAICGGGASLILIPILGGLLPTALVPFALSIGTLSSSVSRIAIFKRHIRWKVVLWFVPFSIPAVILGALLIKHVNPFYLQFLVALFLLANLPLIFQNKKQQELSEKPYPNYILAIVGFIAGFVSGVTGAIGLLFNRFYLRYGLSKEEIVATRAANEVVLHCIKLVVYILIGLYSSLAFWLGLCIALASVFSSFTLKYILPFISDFLFRKIGYSTMVLSGMILLITTTSKIITQDGISISKIETLENQETTLTWRSSSLTLEYGFDEFLEVEIAIEFNDLPKALQEHYLTLKSDYDQILLEKVYRLGNINAYEFYCFKQGKLEKKVFEEDILVH